MNNLPRTAVQAADLTRRIRRAQRAGLSVAEIAGRFRISEAPVRNRLTGRTERPVGRPRHPSYARFQAAAAALGIDAAAAAWDTLGVTRRTAQRWAAELRKLTRDYPRDDMERYNLLTLAACGIAWAAHLIGG